MKIFSDLSLLLKIMVACVIIGFLVGLYVAHLARTQSDAGAAGAVAGTYTAVLAAAARAVRVG